MLLQISLFTLALFHVASSETLRDDQIAPVDLSYTCLSIQDEDEEHNKSPIVLIHGLMGSRHNWKGVQQVLAVRTGRRVCSVDQRNHGDSPWSNRTDIEAMAVDIGHFLDKENIQKANLIGHSLGGKASVHYALKNPERVDSLVVEDMRPNGVVQPELENLQRFASYVLEAIKLVPEESTLDEAKEVVINYLIKKLSKKDGFNFEMYKNAVRKFLEIRCVDGKWELKTNPRLLQDFINDPDYVLTESKGLYEGPALFIYGKISPLHVDKDEENILKLFPNAKLIGIEGATHAIHGLHREFEDEVIKFLK